MYPSQSERGERVLTVMRVDHDEHDSAHVLTVMRVDHDEHESARVLTVMRVDHGEHDGKDEHDDDDDDAPRDTRRLTAAPSIKAHKDICNQSRDIHSLIRLIRFSENNVTTHPPPHCANT